MQINYSFIRIKHNLFILLHKLQIQLGSLDLRMCIHCPTVSYVSVVLESSPPQPLVALWATHGLSPVHAASAKEAVKPTQLLHTQPVIIKAEEALC